ncbi:MAG: type IV pilus twitching motility protein PilT [Heliobacteriaceae bacterium]|nr:type IV pilus twitching motility protein PilT [Heliobacteriaceae bacterium]
MFSIDELLTFAVKIKASDVHLTVGMPPCFRINGQLVSPMAAGVPAGSGDRDWACPLLPADTEVLAGQVMSGPQQAAFAATGDQDLAYSIRSVGRFRVNVFRQRGGTGLAIRLIPFHIPTFAGLGLPEVVAGLARRPNGLVLVTGPTGSGKSTTLAAIIDFINSGRAAHIITLEDPIEFLHSHKKSIVNQREIGMDSQSFAKALRAAMRQDPDVILVGEMRDLKTISTAITAAETGHLVLATLHTNDTIQTVDRIIDAFPVGQQAQIRVQLATVLQGVVSQQLLSRADGEGRALAQEILVATPAVRNLIREGKTHQIGTIIQTGGKLGMQSMDTALKNLLQREVITRAEALRKSSDPEAFQRFVLRS